MDRAREPIGLILVKSAVVNRQASGIPGRFTQSHMVEKPMGASRHAARQAHGGCGQKRAHQIVCIVPLTKPASKEHYKHHMGILANNIGAPHVIESAVVGAEAADRVWLSRSTTKSPKVTSLSQHRNPA